MKLDKGITLIVLVITIVVLIVLSGVAIASLTGRNSITDKAAEAKTKAGEAGINEETTISEYQERIQEKVGKTESNKSVGERIAQILTEAKGEPNEEQINELVSLGFREDCVVGLEGGYVYFHNLDCLIIQNADGSFSVASQNDSNIVSQLFNATSSLKDKIIGQKVQTIRSKSDEQLNDYLSVNDEEIIVSYNFGGDDKIYLCVEKSGIEMATRYYAYVNGEDDDVYSLFEFER